TGEHLDPGEILGELPVDLEQVVLGLFDQHQGRRVETADRAAELRADAPAGPGDQDLARPDDPGDGVVVEPDGVPVQEDFARQLVDGAQVGPPGDDFPDARDDLDADPALDG